MPGFTYQDLHRAERLADLDRAFLEELRRENAALHARLIAYRADPARYAKAIAADWGHFEVDDLLAGVNHVIATGVAAVVLTLPGWALAAAPEIDVIVLSRGGGSFEDLLPFSDERLVRTIASCPVPVVSAVGHEQDNPLCDFAADARASTPTAAARLVVPDATELLARLGEARAESNSRLGDVAALAAKNSMLDAKAVAYSLDTGNDKGTLHLNRLLNVDLVLVPVVNYPALRQIFQIVRTGDEEQVILQPGGSTASN